MKKLRWMAGVMLAGLAALTGCKSQESYESDRAEKAVQYFEQAKWSQFKANHEFKLEECIDLALKFNLDIKVAKLEEEVASEMQIAEALGMLPELTVSNNLSYRNNTPASSSEALVSTGATYGYSTSQDKDINYLNIDLALSLMDFGLAAFNTCQANDRTLIRTQRTRRAAQNLQMDVVRVYFQVAAAQRAITITNALLDQCKTRYELIKEMAQKRLISPFRAFDETRRFVDMEKRLTNYTRSYENSRAELRALLGLAAGNDIVVDSSMLNVNMPPVFDLPEMQVMEQIALLQRPELYEIDMQRHINVLELYKTIVMMFPNVRMYLDFTNSTNSFLYHSSWMEIGIRAAYNLLKLPQQIARAKAYYTQIQAEEARGFSQAISIIAQVRIADANMKSTYERFQLDNKIYNAYNENLKNAEKSLKTSGGLSKLELDHIRLATAETQIERLMSLGNYYVSYYRLLNTLGIDRKSLSKGDDFVTACQKKLEEAKAEAEEGLREAWAEAKANNWEDIPATAPTFVNAPVVKKVAPAAKPAVKAPAKPAVKAPAVKAPAKPAVKAPAVKAPAKPAVKAPAVKAPEVKAPAKPAVKAPEVKAPAVKAPAVKAPAVKAPAVKAPAVKAPVKK